MEVSCLENKNIKEAMEIAISIGLIGKKINKVNSKSLC